MENALLVGLSRQVALRRELDMVANNLANLGTNGFKGEKVLFEDYMMPVARAETFRGNDRRLAYVHDWGAVRDLAPGTLKLTGNDLDLAIDGEGYFAVETPAGERYTRNGSFALNAERELVTAEGLRVMGEAGPIVFEEDDMAIAVASDGTVSSEEGERGRIRIVEFANPQTLEAQGSSLFAASEPPLAAEASRIAQGALEGSNVQAIREITRMVEVNRAYQSLANMMNRNDELRRTAIEQLAQVQA